MADFFKSPFYFLACAGLGFLAWSFSFGSDLNDKNYFLNQRTHEAKFSSLQPERKTEYNEKENLITTLEDESDATILNELQLDDNEWQQTSSEPYSTSPAEVEEYDQILSDSYGEVTDLQDFLQVSTESPQVTYEDEKKCGPQRLSVDSIIKKNKSVSDLIIDIDEDEKYFPKKCITHVMNKFNISNKNLAKCPRGLVSEPLRMGTKPCVSKAIVNMTYNSFVDVTRCLGVNPKSLIPKLSNESGMLINTLGSGLDAGVGQLTRVAIEEVNKYYDAFMQEIESKASSQPACARILKHKSLIGKISDAPEKRCVLIAPPENPLKNILYMTMLNRINMNSTKKRFENNDIAEKLNKLGLSDKNVPALIEAVSLASYNSGPATAFNALNEYLDKRLKIGKKVTAEDFDFHNPKMAKDIDGTERTVTKIAKSFVTAPAIRFKDPAVKIKIARVKLLPEKIRKAYLLTFPEYLIYSQNNFDENQKTITKSYKTIGAPGYLGFLADKNKALRQTFSETSGGADYCSNPDFLKIK